MKHIMDMKDRPECRIEGPAQVVGGDPLYCHHIKADYLKVKPVEEELEYE